MQLFQTLQKILPVTITLFVLSCNNDDDISIEYKKGECWVEHFRNNSFPSKAFFKDKIYCSSIEIGSGKQNYLYCLNLNTGKVDWSAKVDSYAAFPPIVNDSFIYFCSYLGNIYKFDSKGNQVWHAKLRGSYAGHSLNILNNNLLVATVTDGIFEYDCQSGQVVSHIGARSLGAPLPVFYKDLVVFAGLNTDTATVNTGTGAICKRPDDNGEIWKKDLGEVSGDKLFTNSGRLYFFSKWKLNCLDITTGALIWRSESVFKHNIQLLDPHLVFNNNLVMYYDADLDRWIEFNNEDGRVMGMTNYLQLLRENKLKVQHFQYEVADAKNNSKYLVLVTDSLDTPADYALTFNIEVKKGN
jgi:outer membrane protein assembly factor BamB